MTTEQQTNKMNEAEIFEGALNAFIEKAKTETDFLGLNEYLVKQTNYIPLLTPERCSYNMCWEVKEKFAKLGIKDWSTFADTEKLMNESLKESATVYKRAEEFIGTIDKVVKDQLNEMVNNGTLTPKEIVLEIFDTADKARNVIKKEIEYLEELADVYATMSIIKVFKGIEKKRQFKINLKKMRGVILDLNFDENGNSIISYVVLIKRGTPAKRGFYQCKHLTGKIYND